MKQTVWVVTHNNYGDDPIIDVFDNKPEARKCYFHYLGLYKYDRVDFNEYPVCKAFQMIQNNSLSESKGIEECDQDEQDASFTAFLYGEDGIIAEDLATYDSAYEAIRFAKHNDWDEVVNNNTGEIIYKR